MKNILILAFLLSLVGCSASIGTSPSTKTTTYTTTPVASETTVVRTSY